MDTNITEDKIDIPNNSNTPVNQEKKENPYNIQKLREMPNKTQTYFTVGNPEDGQLDIDLISLRERNIETRYLALSFTGMNHKSGQQNESFINIASEEEFLALKRFFAQLEWND